MNIKTSQLANGVYLAACKTEKFKSAIMTVSFAVPLEAETASGYSLLTNLLSLSTGSYKTMQSFSIIKDELYALGLDAYVQRSGELLLVRLEINTIADSFAFNGERVLFRATQLLSDAIFNPHLENGVFPDRNVETEKVCLIEEIESLIENKPAFAMSDCSFNLVRCYTNAYADKDIDMWAIGVRAAMFVGLAVDLHLIEVPDFLCQIFGYDLADDNWK